MPGLSPTTGKNPVMADCLSNFQNRKCPLTRSPLVYRVQKFTGVLARTLQIWCDVYPEETMHNIRLISEIRGETFCVCVDPLWVRAHPPWLSEERTQEDSANQTQVPWSVVKGWTMIWGETREDSANQMWVPWSTMKGWMMIWGEDTRRQCQSDASPLVHREGVDNDLRRGCKKTVPIRHESPGPPWRGGQWPEERMQEDSVSQMQVHSPLIHREGVDNDLRRGHSAIQMQVP